MINVIQGADKVVNLSFEQGGAAYSLSGVTAMRVFFPGAIVKTLASGAVAIISASGGTAEVTLSNADTTAMTAGQSQSIEVEVTAGADIKIIPLRNVLNVSARLSL